MHETACCAASSAPPPPSSKSLSCNGATMISRGVLERVFKIECAGSVGSCFAVEANGRQYVITARHVIENASNGKVRLFRSGIWKEYEVAIVGKAAGSLDIAVLAFPEQLCPPFGFKQTSGIGLGVGQDAYFLGFPYGLHAENDPRIGDFPLALVKRGIVSAFVGLKPMQTDLLLLDGHNNPGFSGGPVVFCASRRVVPENHTGEPIVISEFSVAAVVSSFRFEWEPVFSNGQETALQYRYNTGIVTTVNIYHAMQLIQANPVGTPIDPNSERDPGTWLAKKGYGNERAIP
jgi:hypothetical protein